MPTLPRAALAVLAALCAVGCAGVPALPARDSLVDAERAFARLSVERGLREAFLANFADDGIAFEPGPVRLKEAWGARPAPADPKAIELAWHPVVAGVARSGALGFTSGPFRLSDTTGRRPAVDGVYFSVWRRDGGGAWKVAIDAGIRTPIAVADDALKPDPIVGAASGPARDGSLAAADARASGAPASFEESLAADARWHVDGRAPVIGKRAIARARGTEARDARFVTLGSEAAASGDLGYTYGRRESDGAPAGHYVHLWTREGDGDWRLVVAVDLE